MGERGFHGNPLLKDGESVVLGVDVSLALKTVAISSWRLWQVEGKLNGLPQSSLMQFVLQGPGLWVLLFTQEVAGKAGKAGRA